MDYFYTRVSSLCLGILIIVISVNSVSEVGTYDIFKTSGMHYQISEMCINPLRVLIHFLDHCPKFRGVYHIYAYIYMCVCVLVCVSILVIM